MRSKNNLQILKKNNSLDGLTSRLDNSYCKTASELQDKLKEVSQRKHRETKRLGELEVRMNNLPYLVRVYKGRNRETRLEKMVRLVTIEGFSSCADERHDPKGSTTHFRLLNKNIIRRKKKIFKASREKRHILQKKNDN